MDEDDNDWLEERNTKAAEAIAAALKNVKSPQTKGKNKEKSREEIVASLARDDGSLRVLSCEEYEMVITVFEQVTSDLVPLLHLDLSRLPTLELLLPYFDAESPLTELALPELPELPWEQSKNGQPHRDQTEWSPQNAYRNLAALKESARVIYSFWKERKEQRQGKSLIPALNFDESNESDPYVCFRRREVKTIRKTRKTDVLHLEKLLKLRLEMQQAVTLMTLMAHRERTKRASLAQDKHCWQVTRDFLDVKRQWNIQGPNAGQEDEELVSGDKREDQLHGVAGAASKKKRRVEEGVAAAAAVKLASKKSRPDDGTAAGQAAASSTNGMAASSSIGLGSAISDRVQAVQAYIERECQRKADGDVGWEEGSDSAFQPMQVPAHLRNFRPIHVDSDTSSLPWSDTSPSNAASSSLPRSGRPASFRRRMGRGGRIFLDRRLPAPSPVPASLSDWPRPEPPTSARRSGLSQEITNTHSSNQSTVEGTEKRLKPWQGVQQAPLTGPFAFSPSIRPSLLSSASPMMFAHTSQGQTQGGDDEKGGDSADASSPTSSSTQQSKHSNATTMARATSTQPTEIEEMDEEIDEATKGLQDDREEEERDDDISEEDWQDTIERWSKLQERWRYDDEGGRWAGLGLCGLGGMEDDDEAIVDDFDQRFMRFRMTLLEEADLMKLSTDLTNVMQAQAAADAPASQPVGYAIYRGDAPSMFHQQQAQQQQQQQQMQRQQAQQQAQAAAAQLASNGSLAAQLQGQNAMAMPNNAIARAVQTNVGGPLTALQQQQQLHQAQLQMALHQQQQRAAAVAMANAQQQGQGTGAASPIARPRSSQQMTAMPHPLSQSFSTNGSQNVPGSASPINNGLFPSATPGMSTMPSPQMQAHLAPARPASSASPVLQQRSSPHVQPASFQSSPAQKHSASPLNQAQMQQRSLAAANGNVPQMNPLAAAAALQQAQAALQAQQQQQGGGGNAPANPNQFSHQLMAMHAALTQNQAQNGGPMQLKLPANRSRALEMAQQAAKLAAAAQQGQLTQNNGASQAQIGMGLLSNLQQQMNFAQNQQQHSFTSAIPNNTANAVSSSPKTKSRS
jgi:enhancer of polycomb-like protein